MDGAVWALADCHVFEPYGSTLSMAALQRRPSFEILREAFGPVFGTSAVTLSGRSADAALADVLQVSQGAPLLVLRRELNADDGGLVQHSVHYLPADRFEFTLSESVSQLPVRAHAFAGTGSRLSLTTGRLGSPGPAQAPG